MSWETRLILVCGPPPRRPPCRRRVRNGHDLRRTGGRNEGCDVLFAPDLPARKPQWEGLFPHTTLSPRKGNTVDARLRQTGEMGYEVFMAK